MTSSNTPDVMAARSEAPAPAADAVAALAATVGAGTVVVAQRTGEGWLPLAVSDRAAVLDGGRWREALDAVLVAGHRAPLDAWEDLRTVVVAPVPLAPSSPVTVIAVLDREPLDVGPGHRTLIRAYAEFLARQLPPRRAEGRRDRPLLRRRSRRQEAFAIPLIENDRTVELLQRRRRFVSEVVHDLRAPLAVIAGNAHLIASHPDDPERIAQHARAITTQVGRMATMVDGLLEAEAREVGELAEVPSDIDVAALVDDIVEGTRQMLPTGSVAVVGEGSGTIRTQRVALQRLLMNLTANAVRSTRAGSIHVTGVQWGDGVVFTVRDTGTGMKAEQVARLQDGHLADHDGSGSGFGLGLSIVVRLARQLGGSAEVDTFTGTGTSVTVWIPDQGPSTEVR